MDYLFLLYVLLSVGLGLGGMVILIQSERTFGGFLFLIGAVLIFTFYGLRWFVGDAIKPNGYTSTTWPPNINMCPDFLSLFNRTVNGKQENVCVDMVGVSTGGIQKLLDPSQATNNNFVFPLHEDLSGQARIDALCQECQTKKVTWEGVYDGVTCINATYAPRSDGSTDTGSGGGSCK